MKSFVQLSMLFLTTTLFVGCDAISTQTYTPQQIKKAAEWSNEDQAPSILGCDEDDPFDCLKSTLSSSVNTALFEAQLVSSQEIDEEIVLKLIIDAEGNISLDEIENSAYVVDAIPDLTSVLESAIASLPQATPAFKTNVDFAVRSAIKLPIRITATPQ